MVALCCILAACGGVENNRSGTEGGTDTVLATAAHLPDTTAHAAVAEPAPTSAPQEERKLRYLYFANGGLIGFYSDGSVAGCPRCDLLVDNINTMNDKEPYTTYKVEGGKLVLANNEVMVPANTPGNTPEWALIDYKWIIQVEG